MSAEASAEDFTLEFLDDPECVLVRVRSAVRVDSGVEWGEAIVADPRYRRGMPLIFDFSDGDPSGATPEIVRGYLARMRDWWPGTLLDEPSLRVANVATSDVTFGFLRVFEAHASQEIDRPRAVFRSLDEALAWLRED